MITEWQDGWGHPQSCETRRKISLALREVWVIERISQYTGRGVIEFSDGELLDCDGLSPFPTRKTIRLPDRRPYVLERCDIPAERAFLRVLSLRWFCRSEGLDYGNLYRTWKSGGWYTDTAELLSRDEWSNVKSKYAIRDCLEKEGQYYELPCGRHRRYQASCRDCNSLMTCPDEKPVRIAYSDVELVVPYGSSYRRLHPPRECLTEVCPPRRHGSCRRGAPLGGRSG